MLKSFQPFMKKLNSNQSNSKSSLDETLAESIHKRTVKSIQSQVKHAPGFVSLKKAGTYCSRSFDYKKNNTQLEVSSLKHILKFDPDEQSVWVEPLVNMEEISRFCLERGFIVPVVTEFKHMTVGGAIQGLGGESSSFRYGFIDESVLEYELIQGNGDCVNITSKTDPDLYHAIPGSFGSFGIVTKIKLKLIRAGKFVHLVYSRLSSLDEVMEIFSNPDAESPRLDFIECIAISKGDYRMCRGYFVDDITLSDQIINRTNLHNAWDPWYYHHLLKKSATPHAHEFIPTLDYLFRWDRGTFWVANINKKHTLLNRLIIGNRIDSKNAYKKLHTIPLEERDKRSFIQDLLMPMSAGPKFLDLLDNNFPVYPLWLIPVRAPRDEKLFSLPSSAKEMYLDVGAWRVYKQPPFDTSKANMLVEKFLRANQGRKWLWSQNYSTRDEFWSIYDQKKYASLRSIKNADHRFVDIYDKVSEKVKKEQSSTQATKKETVSTNEIPIEKMAG